MPNTEMAQYVDDSLNSLTQWKPPSAVLAEARAAATELVEVIKLKKNPVKFNGEQYLEFEDWQTCARFYGCTVKIESVSFCEYAGVKGFEAVAIVLDRNQAEISRAESMCLNDEENWGMRAQYKWEDELDDKGKKIWMPPAGSKKGYYKGHKVKTGEVATPLFQLKSMAQTRACAKALRQVFAWVVVLAGYKPSVAEEMNPNDRDNDERGEQQQDSKQQAPNAQRKSEKQQSAPPQEETICAECRGPNGAHTDECQSGKKAADVKSDTKKDGSPKKTPEELDRVWDTHEGHDVEKHISRGQGIAFIRISQACGLNDEAQKLVIKGICGEEVTSRNHIPKEKFAELLDAVDSEFKHHERPEPY